MTNKIAFDTLDYAKMLESGGVEHPDVHSSSLAKAIVQNIYIKDEVDKMIETTFREFAERTRALEKHWEEKNHALDKRMETNFKEFENRLEKIATRTIFTTVSILGTLIVLVGAVTTCAHYFIK